jgi:formylmethanofuran dehydrogenase subunit E
MDNLNNPEQIKALIQALQSLLPKEEAKKTNITTEQSNSKIKTKTRSRKKSNNPTNKFLSMPEMNMFKADVEIDKKLSKHPPTPRNREYQPVKVKCRSCGKQEEVNPAILPDSTDRYKCNKCSSSAGE